MRPVSHARLTLLLALVLALAGGARPSAADSQNVSLIVGRSMVLDTGKPIARVSLTSPDVADALVTAPNELLLNGKAPGTISMFVWDRAGAIKRYEVVVRRDVDTLSSQIHQLFPGEPIDVQSSANGLVLAGRVSSKDVMDRAVNLATGYVDKKENVVNLLQIEVGAPSNQVLLHVRFAEVSRNALTELGASFFTGANGYKNFVGRTTTQQYGNTPTFDNKGPNGNELVFSDYMNLFLFDMKNQLGTVIHALQNKGLFQSLAEPNLVAESGKEASFLAGGEFPIPVAQGTGSNVAVTIQFKEFGIRLKFTPTIIGNRIHLKVAPEVSSLDFGNAIVLQGFRIPALSTRRAETELELQNLQTFAIAGLLNNTMQSTLEKIPGIGDIPILGLLFRSKSAQKDRTELVVMITPEILPNNSRGVTPNLPRQQEPYLPPLAPNKSLEPPPAGFPPGAGGTTAAAQSLSPADAAATVSALTPAAGPVAHADGQPAAPAGAPAGTPASVTRPMTAQERKALERAQKDQAKKAEADRKKAEAEKRRQDKLAREQAKRDAEAAKKAAEAAKRQAELDKQHQQELAEAQAKLKAAQDAYQAELAKIKQP